MCRVLGEGQELTWDPHSHSLNDQRLLLLFRYRKKSSVTDSFSNLVHRTTMDQFTEGVAPRCLLSPAGPGQPRPRPREGQEGRVPSQSR